MYLKLLSALSLGSSIFIMYSPAIAEAGYRRCQGYPNNISACVNETGFKFNCTGDVSYTRIICTGQNNYRKECTVGGRTSTCNDSNGIRYVCKHEPYTNTVCDYSNGFRSICKSYPDGNYSICTDVSRWGKPIKS
jgi:hypothetical protein